jgi:hypothetical protein
LGGKQNSDLAGYNSGPEAHKLYTAGPSRPVPKASQRAPSFPAVFGGEAQNSFLREKVTILASKPSLGLVWSTR